MKDLCGQFKYRSSVLLEQEFISPAVLFSLWRVPEFYIDDTQWIYYYFHLALECDVPILESYFTRSRPVLVKRGAEAKALESIRDNICLRTTTFLQNLVQWVSSNGTTIHTGPIETAYNNGVGTYFTINARKTSVGNTLFVSVVISEQRIFIWPLAVGNPGPLTNHNFESELDALVDNILNV